MKILIYDRQKDFRITKKSIEPIILEVLEKEKVFTDEVYIHFVTKPFITRLHKKFFQDSTPTDCISFPIDGKTSLPYHVLGEIFICPKTAGEVKKDDPYKEMTLYLVHGLLHLIGYEDSSKEEKKKMRAKESVHMKNLVKKNSLIRP